MLLAPAASKKRVCQQEGVLMKMDALGDTTTFEKDVGREGLHFSTLPRERVGDI